VTASTPTPPTVPPPSAGGAGQPPDAPTRTLPSETDPLYPLWKRVQETLSALPFYFRSATTVTGIDARDLFTLNSALGATIEKEVVDTLNNARKQWDPDDDYPLYGFVRQPQTFPDVRLQKVNTDGSIDVLFGIELKGWWLLAKEGEPSARYSPTPLAANDPWDLLVFVPWYLDQVISGTPRALPPFITGARYAAEMRNYYWQHLRGQGDPRITHPPVVTPPPYPSKATQISDRPKFDSGGNFGRVARSGIMDKFVKQTLAVQLNGIEADLWRAFFASYAENATPKDVLAKLERTRKTIQNAAHTETERAELIDALNAIVSALLAGSP
jgi:hypothetical protein